MTKNATTRFWSLPEAKEIWHGELDYLWARTFGEHLIGWSVLEDQGDGVHRRLLRGWPLGGGEPETFAVYAFPEDVIPPRGFGVDTKRQALITWVDGVLYELPIRAESASPRQMLHDPEPITRFATVENHLGVTEHLVTEHASGRIQVWSRSRENDRFVAMRAFYGSPQRPSLNLDLDASGEWLAAGKGDETVELWNLGAPPDASPLVLRRGDVTRVINARFHPRGGMVECRGRRRAHALARDPRLPSGVARRRGAFPERGLRSERKVARCLHHAPRPERSSVALAPELDGRARGHPARRRVRTSSVSMYHRMGTC